MTADDDDVAAGFDRRLLESEATVLAWREMWPGMSTQQMCAQEGRLWMSVVTAGLIWPEFRLYRDLVLLAERFTADNVDEWRAAVGHRGAAEVEKVVNHVHLWDVFTHEAPDAGVSLGQLTLLLRDTWRAKLERDFPDRDFVVAATPHDGPDYGPTITFWQRAPETDR